MSDSPIDRPLPRLTISIPVFNEEGNIDRLLDALGRLAATHSKYDFEFLFTDNCSTDGTYPALLAAAAKDVRVRVVRFSRNFGYQRSIMTNYLLASGEAAVQFDADLQDPPEIVSKFIKLWEQGYKVVYGIRRHRRESFLIGRLRRLYYRTVSSISDTELPRNAGDFRLIDRVIIEHLRTINDRSPYIRGIVSSLGYKQIGVKYDRAERKAGRTKFTFLRLVRLGIDGITSQSTAPLHYITMFGFLLSLMAAFAAVGYLVWWAVSPEPIAPGFTTLVLLQLFMLGLNACFLGILGEYVSRIFDNVRQHPFTIIDRTVENGREQIVQQVFTASGVKH